ncbi:hypothetical protein [Paradevosia shaoguanensis]|uniref:hypothetical protein n=1 Tax=Paradevosia shaoguanensis TaxID=1335043 RepID=UPI00193176CD|nr:hypothetical protein [Paradevosia shaoguanensis]
MREKIAMAILAKVPRGYGMTKAEASDYADAVLDALMEPTQEMNVAGSATSELTPDEVRPSTAATIFRAMIQAARDGA